MTYGKLPAGVQDVLPRECRVLNYVKGLLARKFSSCGYEPVLSAALEYYDGQAKNAVPQERLFKMTDTDGKLLVLRPDITQSIARIAATKLKDPCARLYYFADKWDLQNGGGLTSREIYQAGVECLGEESAFSDAQTIAFAVECLQEIGLNDFVIDIGHVGYFKGILEESGLDEAAAEETRISINLKDGLNAERIMKKAGAKAGALNSVLALPTLFGGAEVLDRAETLTENAQALSAIARLKQVYGLLLKMGYGQYVCFDLGTVKRLSYYSGIVFSGLVKELGVPVLSGGRYDGLADGFGRHIPAVGFAMGLKRVLVALERRGTLPEEERVALVVCEEGAEEEGFRFYRELTKETRASLSSVYGFSYANAKAAEGKYAAVYYATKDGTRKL